MYEGLINFELAQVAGYIQPNYMVVQHSVYVHVADVVDRLWHSTIALTSFSCN